MLKAPLNLKLKTGCKSSLFKRTSQPNLAERLVAGVKGVVFTRNKCQPIRSFSNNLEFHLVEVNELVDLCKDEVVELKVEKD